MVHFNAVALFTIAFGAASVMSVSIFKLEFQARSAELTDLIEARDQAYMEYEAR